MLTGKLTFRFHCSRAAKYPQEPFNEVMVSVAVGDRFDTPKDSIRIGVIVLRNRTELLLEGELVE